MDYQSEPGEKESREMNTGICSRNMMCHDTEGKNPYFPEIITFVVHIHWNFIWTTGPTFTHENDGLMQGRRNSIANALELRLSCTNPLRSCMTFPMKYAHSFVEVLLSAHCDSCDWFIHILQDCFTDSETIITLKDMGKTDHCQTMTKHYNAWTLCIILESIE